MILYHITQIALRHYRICEIQTIELHLAWLVADSYSIGNLMLSIFWLLIYAKLLYEILFIMYILTLLDQCHDGSEVIIERTMDLKLQCTDRVGDTLEEVRLSMSEIVHWISIPSVSSTMVRILNNAIHDRIAEMHVWISHVNLRTKDHGAFLKFAFVHTAEKVQILFNRTITEW